MNAHRIRWWVYLLAFAFGSLIGLGIAALEERRDFGLMGTPWFISVIMFLAGIVELVLAWQVHKYTTTDPKKRAQLKRLDPERAVNTLILAKALALAGAMLAGCYGAQILVCIPRIEAPYYRSIVTECVAAAIVSLFDLVAGIVGEWWCRLPPMDGPEHPAVQERKAPRAQMA